jgi:hypothetical protein
VTYRIGVIVLHEQCSKDVVLKRSPRKCIVLFQDKERLMASADARRSLFRSLRGLRRVP